MATSGRASLVSSVRIDFLVWEDVTTGGRQGGGDGMSMSGQEGEIQCACAYSRGRRRRRSRAEGDGMDVCGHGGGCQSVCGCRFGWRKSEECGQVKT